MNENAPDTIDKEYVARWSLRARDVFILGSVSALLFVWTHHPAIGAVLPLLLSGRTCWNAGWWLFDRDPDRQRALTLLLFYIALTGWHAGAAALGTVVGCIVLQENGWLQVSETRMMWTFLIMLLALIWNGVLCSAALYRALRQGQKIWLSPNVPKQCDYDFELLPSLEWDPRNFNRAVFVIAAGVGFPILIMFSLILGMIPLVIDVPKHESLAIALFGVVAAGMFIMPIVLVSILVHRIAAVSPRECWGTQTEHVR